MNVFHLAPAVASTAATRFDTVFLAVLLITGAVALAIFVLIGWFCFRYRAGSGVRRGPVPRRGRVVEIAWTLTPLAIFVAVFAWGAVDYADLYRAPPDAMPVYVIAKQWMWKLEHANGRREIDELHVPLGQPVRLIMTSQDVIHSFYVPAFRLKQDVVPGRYTSLWFTATQAGDFRLFCAEYCGTAHAHMLGRVVVMRPDAFAAWLASSSDVGLAQQGFAAFRRLGCSGCHDPRSSAHAPDLNGLIGRTVHLSDGRTLVADENYVRDSILLPRRDVVAGYAPIMPSFAGQVSEEEIAALIAYIRSTNAGGPDPTMTKGPTR